MNDDKPKEIAGNVWDWSLTRRCAIKLLKDRKGG